MSSYNPSEANLPKWAQAELDKLRNEVINLRASESARLVAHVVRLDQDWFVMPGPAEGPALDADGGRPEAPWHAGEWREPDVPAGEGR